MLCLGIRKSSERVWTWSTTSAPPSIHTHMTNVTYLHAVFMWWLPCVCVTFWYVGVCVCVRLWVWRESNAISFLSFPMLLAEPPIKPHPLDMLPTQDVLCAQCLVCLWMVCLWMGLWRGGKQPFYFLSACCIPVDVTLLAARHRW